MAYPAIAQEECVLHELEAAVTSARVVALDDKECVAHPQTAPNVEQIVDDFVNQHYFEMLKGLAKV